MVSKRFLDLALALALCVPALLICLICAPFIYFETRAHPLFRQTRVGKNNRHFGIVKLRTMRSDTANVASHEVSSAQITRVGMLLRRFKFDELPQIWNVLAGTMSFVGPRPCLPSQTELIVERTRRGVSALLPGITGPGQVAGLDMSDPSGLATADAYYIGAWSLRRDLAILYRTVIGGGRGDAALGSAIPATHAPSIHPVPIALGIPSPKAPIPDAGRVVITGAGGFLGQKMVANFVAAGWHVDALVRRRNDAFGELVVQHGFDDLASADVQQLSTIMKGASCLIHLAATVPGKGRAHASGNTVAIADRIATAATAAGVTRMIVMSSIAAALVEKRSTHTRAYGVEKWNADSRFKEIAQFVPTIFLRPPVVYGRGMSGALSMLAKAVSKGIPLPLGCANEARSYISRTNLVALVGALAIAPDAHWEKASGRAYTPTDGTPVSTANLIRALARTYGVRARLLPVPLSMLRLFARMANKSEMLSGAIDPLPLNDNARLFDDFGWRPVEQYPASLACLTGGGRVDP